MAREVNRWLQVVGLASRRDQWGRPVPIARWNCPDCDCPHSATWTPGALVAGGGTVYSPCASGTRTVQLTLPARLRRDAIELAHAVDRSRRTLPAEVPSR